MMIIIKNKIIMIIVRIKVSMNLKYYLEYSLNLKSQAIIKIQPHIKYKQCRIMKIKNKI